MRKQLFGMGLIFLGIMFAILVQTFNIWLPIVGGTDTVGGILSLALGISGIIVIWNNIED